MKLFLSSNQQFLQDDHLIYQYKNKKFAFSEQNEFIYEIKLSQCQGTTYIDNYIIDNSDTYIANEIDPIFIILEEVYNARGTISKQSEGKFQPLSNILEFSEFEQILKQNKRLLRSLAQICEVKEIEIGEDNQFYRFNDEKFNQWLDKKKANLQEAIKHLSSENQQTGYKGVSDLDMISFQFIAEYLPYHLFSQYLIRFGLIPDNIYMYKRQEETQEIEVTQEKAQTQQVKIQKPPKVQQPLIKIPKGQLTLNFGKK